MINEYQYLIYPRRLWVATKDEKLNIRARFFDREGKDVIICDDDENPCKAQTWSVEEKETGRFGSLVYISESLTPGDMAHEAFHVCSDIFSDMGIEHDLRNQEFSAYMIGFTTDCINEAINLAKRNGKRKKNDKS